MKFIRHQKSRGLHDQERGNYYEQNIKFVMAISIQAVLMLQKYSFYSAIRTL